MKNKPAMIAIALILLIAGYSVYSMQSQLDATTQPAPVVQEVK